MDAEVWNCKKNRSIFFSNNLYKAAFECRWSSTYKDLRIFLHLVKDTIHQLPLAIFHNIGLAKKFIQVFL